MSFEVALQQFNGPLTLLLELIHREELPITDVSLAEITDDYLRYLDAHEVPPEELADFLIVATKLLLIKSKAILPMPALEEEEDESSLAIQLRMYKEFAQASLHIEQAVSSADRAFARERLKIEAPEGFFPPAGMTPSTLKDAFARLMKRLEPFFTLQQSSMQRVVSVQEKLNHMREAVASRARMTFRDAIKNSGSKVDVVVSFLALLELMKQRIVSAVQSDTFSDITITHVD